jgi:predicted transcriptional regulator
MREKLRQLVEDHAESGCQLVDLAENAIKLSTSRLREFLETRGMLRDGEEPQDAAIRLLAESQSKQSSVDEWQGSLRRAALAEIRKHPGSTAQQVAKTLGLTAAMAQRALLQLCRDEQIALTLPTAHRDKITYALTER